MKTIRYQTLQKKYFKKEKSLNLLTWRAKEQMRYLHYKDPVTWSVIELADNFPVSKESVVKILKSRIRKSSEEDIEKHDDMVRKNWITMKNSLLEEQELPSSFLEGIFNSDNECMALNADGLLNQPFPIKINYLKKGAFSDIVSDCSSPRTLPTLPDFDRNSSSIKEVLAEVSDFITDITSTFPDFFKSSVGDDNNVINNIETSLPAVDKNTNNIGKTKLKNVVYQSGKKMYNKDGEFLYAIP